jgi:hypothetical protein
MEAVPPSGESSRREQILSAYRDFVLKEGTQPRSVHSFSQALGFTEAEFYQHYSSFAAVEADFWLQAFEQVRAKLIGDSSWEKFRFRERVLLFAFTLTQTLLSQRSFAIFSLKQHSIRDGAAWQKFREGFETFFGPLLSAAIESGELVNRRYFRDRYLDALWAQTQFVLRFWAGDSSEGFEKTDEAIEKGFSLAIDFMSRSAVDNAIEYGKFLIRNRVAR